MELPPLPGVFAGLEASWPDILEAAREGDFEDLSGEQIEALQALLSRADD